MIFFIGLLLALFLGILSGCFTGLIPGVHVNLISVILLSLVPLFPPAQIFLLVIFVVSLSITHTFVDFIPSVFLGSPDEDTALSVLPGHELLLKGEGSLAVFLSSVGGLLGLLIILLFLPLAFFVLPPIYPFLQRALFFPLFVASLYLLFRSRKEAFFWALIIFVLSGILGFSTLNFHGLNQPLLPLLTGLFGGSSLVLSIIHKPVVPKQKVFSFRNVVIGRKRLFDSFIASFIVSPICSLLPSLGSSQAAVFGSDIISDPSNPQGHDRNSFLLLLGSINTVVMGVSFITLFLLNRTRTGSAAFISEVLPSITSFQFFIIITIIILSGFLSFFITLFLSRIFSKNIHRFNYRVLSLIILLFISFLVSFFSGINGFVIFLSSLFLGLSAVLLGVRRIVLMGCLMIPSMIYYWPF